MDQIQSDAATFGMIVGFFIPLAAAIVIGAVMIIVKGLKGE